MRHTKDEKIAYLFDEIGGISDVLITEAVSYRPKVRRAPVLKYLGVAACVLLCCVIFLRAGKMVGELFPSVEKEEAPATQNSAGIPSTLDALLSEHRGDLHYTSVSSVGELDFFAGDAYIVWQVEGSDELFVSRNLTNGELQRLKRYIPTGRPVGENPKETPICRVWIVCGDGSVLTPYLKANAGNVGSGILFEYDPELIPSSTFISCVSDILEKTRS